MIVHDPVDCVFNVPKAIALKQGLGIDGNWFLSASHLLDDFGSGADQKGMPLFKRWLHFFVTPRFQNECREAERQSFVERRGIGADLITTLGKILVERPSVSPDDNEIGNPAEF